MDDYLYHYTSLEKLALILKNQTIRLNSLENMDDLQEKDTKDMKNFGRFFFVSSWTSDKTESIPMWKMYTDSKAGVRIGLPKNPFMWHPTSAENIYKKYGMVPEKAESTFLDAEWQLDNRCYSPQTYSGDILHKVEYTNDITLLNPQISTVTGNSVILSGGKMGRYKNSHWSFQNEWRYLLQFSPIPPSLSPITAGKEGAELVENMIKGIASLPFTFYDLDIAPEFFNKMELTISPQMTLGNRILLDLLVKKYNPNAVVSESELLGLI